MLKTILLAACLMLMCFVLDGLWLGVVGKSFYQKQIGSLMYDSPLSSPLRLAGVIVIYILIIAAILNFIVLTPQGALNPFWKGAFLGLVIYGVYDLTNYATLRGWPLTVCVVDAAWGALLCGLLAWAGSLLARRWML